MDFEKLRYGRDFNCGSDNWIETLNMPCLQDPAGPRCAIDQQASISERCGEWFLHKNIDVVVEKVYADTRVVHRGHGKTNGIDSSKKLVIVRECLSMMNLSNFFGAIPPNIDDCGELHRF